MRLLQLSSYVQQFLATDKISAGHAKMMIGLTAEEQKKICDTIIGQKLSVRETEKLIKDLKEKDSPKLKKEKVTNSYNISNLKSFAEFLKNDKIKAKIDKNSIKIEFNSQEDIDKISSYFKIQ